MLASIHPLGERARNSRFGLTATAYVLGSAAGGACTGAILGLIGEGLDATFRWSANGWTAAFLIVAIAGAATDLSGARPPSWRRQVNEDWLRRYRGWVYGVGFGFQLGMGFVTIVTSAVLYVAFATALFGASWKVGAVVGATFGLVRAVQLFWIAKVRRPDQLRDVHRRMQSLALAARRVAVGGQLVAAAGALAVVAGQW